MSIYDLLKCFENTTSKDDVLYHFDKIIQYKYMTMDCTCLIDLYMWDIYDTSPLKDDCLNKILLKSIRINVNRKSVDPFSTYQTILHRSIAYFDNQIVKILLDRDDIDIIIDFNNIDILNFTLDRCNLGAFRILTECKHIKKIKYEPDILIRACHNKHIEIVKLMIKNGFIFNKKNMNYEQFDTIIKLIGTAPIEFVELLMTIPNFNVNNISISSEYTALHHAAINNKYLNCALLLKCKDIDVNVKNYGGYTALMLADLKITKELLKHKDIDVNIKNCEGNTALDNAKIKHYSRIANELSKYSH